MRIADDIAAEIGMALNEAAFLGAEYDAHRNIVGLTFAVLTLPDNHSSEPTDPRRQIILTEIGRIAAALRDAYWNDTTAKTIPFPVSDLLAIVQSFGGQPIYGWQFINNDDKALDEWKNRLSLDFTTESGSMDNRLMLFQEGATSNRHLDLWIWFGGLLIRDANGDTISPVDFVAGGKQWWDAMHAGDPRTDGHGIVAGGIDSGQSDEREPE
ncbi:MAG: hypothetical protein L0H94_13885 [Nitrospira sp.]|nr:hypothetical protein [Nitrospira sp.]